VKNVNPKHYCDTSLEKGLSIPSQSVIHHDEETEICRYTTRPKD